MLYRAAKLALEDAKASNNKEREYASANTLLRPALDTFISAANRKRLLGLLEPNHVKKSEFRKKVLLVAILCTRSYSKLKEWNLVEK